jgi:hypothetical protein
MSLVEIGKVPTKRAKPEFVKIGNREIISSCRWNDDLMADYVLRKERWIKMGELAAVAYGSQSIKTKTQARKRHASLARKMLERGFLLLKRPGPHGRIGEVKVYMRSEKDQQEMFRQVEEMRRRSEYSVEQYERAVSLV